LQEKLVIMMTLSLYYLVIFIVETIVLLQTEGGTLNCLGWF